MSKLILEDGETRNEVEIIGGPCVEIKGKKGGVTIEREDWFVLAEFVARNMVDPRERR